MLIPNTVALVQGGPHPQEGRHFIDFLLSPRVEERLAHTEAGQIPLRSTIPRPAHVPTPDRVKAMDVDYEKVADWMESSGQLLQKLFVR